VTMSMWSLSGTLTGAFAARPSPRRVSRLCSRAGAALALVAYERRALPAGEAVCLLSRRTGRRPALCAGLAVTLALLTGAAPLAGLALGVMLGAGAGYRLWEASTGKGGSAARKRLPHSTGRRCVYVHSVASRRRGAGAELMDALSREADDRGWTLELHADNARLAQYYQQFGFVLVGPTPRRTGATSTVHWMRRPPRCSPEQPLSGLRDLRGAP